MSHAHNDISHANTWPDWHEWPALIRQLRHTLAEDVETFGARFARGGRAVENWEQGRRVPDRLVQDGLVRLRDDIQRRSE